MQIIKIIMKIIMILWVKWVLMRNFNKIIVKKWELIFKKIKD